MPSVSVHSCSAFVWKLKTKPDQKVMERVWPPNAVAYDDSYWAVMNQWTVPLEWNGGMEYWNDTYSPCYFFLEAVTLEVCNGSVRVSQGLANLY